MAKLLSRRNGLKLEQSKWFTPDIFQEPRSSWFLDDLIKTRDRLLTKAPDIQPWKMDKVNVHLKKTQLLTRHVAQKRTIIINPRALSKSVLVVLFVPLPYAHSRYELRAHFLISQLDLWASGHLMLFFVRILFFPGPAWIFLLVCWF